MASKREVAIIIKAIDKASRTLKGISSTGTRALKSIAIGAGAVTAAFGAMGAGYTMLLKKGIEYNNRMEGYAAVLTGVFQDQKKAIEETRWAIELAAKTPFQIPEIVEAQKMLEAYGISARKVLPFLADMAAATGKEILQAAEAVIGAQMGIWRRLRQFAIRPEMLIPYGLEMTAQKQVKNLDSIIDAIIRYGTEVKHWSGMTDIFANKFRGLTSNLEDLWYGVLGVLAEPAFEEIKNQLRDVLAWGNKLKQEGRLKEMLSGWGDAAAEIIKRLSTLVRTVGPDLLEALEESGKQFNMWVKGIDLDRIRQTGANLLRMAEAMAKLAIRAGTLIAQHWRLIATFTGLLVITVVTAKIGLYITAIGKAVIAIKGFIITHQAAILAMTGPGGMIVALAALVSYLGIKYFRAVDKAREATRALVLEALRLKGLKFMDFGSQVASMEKLNEAIGVQRTVVSVWQSRLKQLAVQMDRYFEEPSESMEQLRQRAVTLSKLAAVPESEQFRKLQTLAREAGRELDTLKRKQEELAAIMLKQMVKGIKTVATEFYQRFIPAAKEAGDALKEIVDPEVVKLQQELSTKLLEVTLDRYSYEYKQAQLHYSNLEKEYQGDAEVSALIVKVKTAHLKSIRAAQSKARAEEIADINDERDAKIEAAEEATNAIIRSLGRQKLAQDRAKKAAIEAAEAGFIARHDAHIRILELEGKTTDAAIQQAQRQAAEVYKATGDMKLAHRLFNLEKVRIYKEAAEEIGTLEREDAEAIMELSKRISDTRVERLEWEMDRTNALRDEAFYKETDRIREIESTYMNYINAALNITDQLFKQQEGGWLRALAMLTRFVTRTVAAYLKERAMEKLKEADTKMTEAAWLRGHATRMAGLAAEALMLSGMAAIQAMLTLDPRQAAAAKQYAALAKTAFGEATWAMGQATALEASAIAMQAEAAALMTTATAVEAVGEVAATGFDLAADKARQIAREEEQRARDRERALEAEFHLQQDILKLQGRTAEAERLAIEREAQQYREIGVDPALIDIWRRLSQGEVAPVQATAPVIPTGVVTGTGGRTVTVYQTNTFAALIDTTDREQLRELAVALRPFNEEIEALEGEA